MGVRGLVVGVEGQSGEKWSRCEYLRLGEEGSLGEESINIGAKEH